mgnify:CR=1 FL=1
MIGAIIGDIVGSPYEFHNIKRKDFPLFQTSSHFTDDTMMTLANAKWLTEDHTHSPAGLVKLMRENACEPGGIVRSFNGGMPLSCKDKCGGNP